MTENTRRHARVPLALEVSYGTAGAFLVAYTTNLSKGGLFLETPTPLPVGTAITLSIAVPAVAEFMVVEGTVAWVRAATGPEGEPVGMGVQFSGLEERCGAIIDRLVATFAGIRILVVAAASATRALLLRYLRSIIAAHVTEAVDGETAEAALEHGFDLCLVDLDDGPEAERAIRAARAGAAPVSVVALGRDEAARSWAQSLGADVVIPRPPSFGSLQAAVIRCLGRPAAVR